MARGKPPCQVDSNLFKPLLPTNFFYALHVHGYPRSDREGLGNWNPAREYHGTAREKYAQPAPRRDGVLSEQCTPRLTLNMSSHRSNYLQILTWMSQERVPAKQGYAHLGHASGPTLAQGQEDDQGRAGTAAFRVHIQTEAW